MESSNSKYSDKWAETLCGLEMVALLVYTTNLFIHTELW